MISQLVKVQADIDIDIDIQDPQTKAPQRSHPKTCTLVETPEPLKQDKDLIQNLRVRTGASDLPMSCPDDPDGFTARLQHVSADAQALSPLPSQGKLDICSREATEPLNEEEEYCRNLEYETGYCNTLVNEGGRPSHPVGLGRDILDDPREYREILSYWQLVNYDDKNHDWQVFRSQMREWRNFCKYQRKTREEQGNFSKYCQRVHASLTGLGFTRPIQLDEDSERQDKLTTWIEFLNYEYQDYDQDMRYIKRHNSQYDEAWKKLVNSQVPGSVETEEFMCSINTTFQRTSKDDQAEEHVEPTNLDVASTKETITSRRSSSPYCQNHRNELAVARSRLDTAIKLLESIERRDDLFEEFKKKVGKSDVVKGELIEDYLTRKDDAKHRTKLLRWILRQIPLIELELYPAKVGEGEPNEGNTRVQKTSKRDRAGKSDEERVLKRQRQYFESSGYRTHASTTKESGSQLKRGRHDSIDEEWPSEQPQYSGQSLHFSYEILDAAGTKSIRKSLSI